MAGKGIDRVKARAAVETARESPAIVAITVAPVLIGFGVLWWAIGFWPTLLLVLLVGVVVLGIRKLRG
ncbi:hypothetical protein GCM10023094_42380 [Rhodococcus olei]|uniref:Uncharacterized protein n=1 Tax=Rhodococcus olei TaxID=2161675 RepID=A0ABP8PFD0_9NOCA